MIAGFLLLMDGYMTGGISAIYSEIFWFFDSKRKKEYSIV